MLLVHSNDAFFGGPAGGHAQSCSMLRRNSFPVGCRTGELQPEQLQASNRKITLYSRLCQSNLKKSDDANDWSHARSPPLDSAFQSQSGIQALEILLRFFEG